MVGKKVGSWVKSKFYTKNFFFSLYAVTIYFRTKKFNPVYNSSHNYIAFNHDDKLHVSLAQDLYGINIGLG